MAGSRRSRKKSKAARHEAASSTASSSVQLTQSEAAVKRVDPAKQAKNVHSMAAKGRTVSVVNAAGLLDWRSVRLVLPGKARLISPPALTAADLSPAWRGVLFAFIGFFGLVSSGRWSLVCMALLAAALLLDKRVRGNTALLWRAATASILSLCLLPVVSSLPTDLPRLDQSLSGMLLVGLFAIALWLLGVVSRCAASLQEKPFPRSGLYGIGVACQSLAVFLVLVALVVVTLVLHS
jgi:hypothetical protein